MSHLWNLNSNKILVCLLFLLVSANTLGEGQDVPSSSALSSSTESQNSTDQVEAFSKKSSGSSVCTVKKLCVFDFDYTLKKGCCYHCCGVLPNEASRAVNECISRDFDIAIASANLNWNFVREFLKDSLPQFESILYTEGVQTGQEYKTNSLRYK